MFIDNLTFFRYYIVFRYYRVVVKQEEDDGHVETVEEVKAKMAAAQAAMDAGLQQTDNRVAQM